MHMYCLENRNQSTAFVQQVHSSLELELEVVQQPTVERIRTILHPLSADVIFNMGDF